MKRLASPKSWPVSRKKSKWIAKPTPGAHHSGLSIPLLVLLRDVLGVVENRKEARFVITQNLVKVNNRKVKDVKLPIGLFDVISLGEQDEYYRITLTRKKKITPIKIKKKEAKLLPLKIEDKKQIKGGKTQLNFSNGWNLVVDKKKYSPGDTLIYNMSSNKISKHIPLKKGVLAFISGGKHAGQTAKVKKVNEEIKLKSGNKTWKGIPKYTVVVGKKSPRIKLVPKK